MTDVIIIGAGASGLMAARELALGGKKVLILEARNRIGGRICPIDESEFGYPAQGGAEYVHGPAPVTHSLAKEANVTIVRTTGDMWDSRDGKFAVNQQIAPGQEILHEKLRELRTDMPILEFFDKYFPSAEHAELRNSVFKTVEGYDAADPADISSMALRDEWLGGEEWIQSRIKEGYGPILAYLESDCRKNGVEIKLSTPVEKIDMVGDDISVYSASGEVFKAKKAIVTVPLAVLSNIAFNPAIPEKLEAAGNIGWGGVIKILLGFKSRWWKKVLGKDMGEMDFLRSDTPISIWWTQHPNLVPVITGWLAGPKAWRYSGRSNEDIIDLALESLSAIFKVKKIDIKSELVYSRVFDWLADPWAKCAYSYSKVLSNQAQEELNKPVTDKLYFAGEALYEGAETATVEGALANGQAVARRVLDTKI